MDDRLDPQFLSGELVDRLGLDYVVGSFDVFGNDGTHIIGQPISTGTGASPTVLSALISASDHLPIVANYVIGSDPGILLLFIFGGFTMLRHCRLRNSIG